MEGLEIARAGFAAAGLLSIAWVARARLLHTRSHDMVFASAMAALAAVVAWGLQLWGEPLDLVEPGWKSKLSIASQLFALAFYWVERRWLSTGRPAPTEAGERVVDRVLLALGLVMLGCAGFLTTRL